MRETSYNTMVSPFLREGNTIKPKENRSKNVLLFVACFLLGVLVADLHASKRNASFLNSLNSESPVGPPTGSIPIEQFVRDLAAKTPTPGGGAAAAISASVGAAAALMSAAYTQRKKDVASGAAECAKQLVASVDVNQLIALADEDAIAYAALQRTWKEPTMPPEEKARIEAEALAVPVKLTTLCHQYIAAIRNFLPRCNDQITSDAKVGIHGLAGAARAAYQTALVNSPDPETRGRLRAMLVEIQNWEAEILGLTVPAAASASPSVPDASSLSLQQQAPPPGAPNPPLQPKSLK